MPWCIANDMSVLRDHRSAIAWTTTINLFPPKNKNTLGQSNRPVSIHCNETVSQ